MALSELERCLINRYQGGFPLCPEPFAHMAEELDSDSDRLIEAIGGLLQHGWLSRFGPLFDAQALGGGLSLAAMAVPETQFSRVAEQLTQMPEVAHNYRREHRLNMWFVLATETPAGIADCCRTIEQLTGIEVHDFPKQREFHLGLWLHLDEQGGCATRPIKWQQRPGMTLDEQDRRIVSITQAGLPLLSHPYQALSQKLGCDQETLLERLQRMLDSGVIRRIGLVPNHYRLGLRGNGMSVWNIPDDRLEQVGEAMGAVSRCTPRWLTWPNASPAKARATRCCLAARC